jgi:hypothetical protein
LRGGGRVADGAVRSFGAVMEEEEVEMKEDLEKEQRKHSWPLSQPGFCG